jgi:hypothetical protein
MMDDQKQFETMAAIRAYAQEIVQQSASDIRPSTARAIYGKNITRMADLAKVLEQRS